jgi:ribosomal protein L7/L12
MKIGKLTFEVKIVWESNYMNQVKNLLGEGKKFAAVKFYMEATGKGLKESKDVVDKLCPEYLKPLDPIEMDKVSIRNSFRKSGFEFTN